MGTPWPYASVAQLKTAGYKFDRISRCRRKYLGGVCNALLHWYITPDGKKIPIDPQSLLPHHSTCPDVEVFRKERQERSNKPRS